MQAAIAAYRKHVADGPAAGRGEKGGEGWTPNIWKTHGVAKASFYKSIAWEDRHPGMKWSGNNIMQRGKVARLTEEMENETIGLQFYSVHLEGLSRTVSVVLGTL